MDDLGLYDETESMYFDRLRLLDGTNVTIKVHSMVGIIPMLASGVVDQAMLDRAQQLGKSFSSHYKDLDLDALAKEGLVRGEPGHQQLLLGMVGVNQVLALMTRLLDEQQFLSTHGLRALSAYHREHPYVLDVEGVQATIDYEPAESTTSMFGGNSNWRGPVWYPLNYLVCSALDRYGHFLGDDVRVEYPTGSDNRLSFIEIASELRKRTISLFLVDEHGRRPCFGDYEKMQTDPRWKDNLLFNEYFHGDTGAGLGATHQTGWTGLVADQIRRIHTPGLLSLADVAHRVAQR
jgi:hypothetical protein